MLDLLKSHLRLCDGAEDQILQLYLDAAKERVSTVLPDGLPENLPKDLHVAVLRLAAHLYLNREGGASLGDIDALLAPHRAFVHGDRDQPSE